MLMYQPSSSETFGESLLNNAEIGRHVARMEKTKMRTPPNFGWETSWQEIT
jgi:hypothetical protein